MMQTRSQTVRDLANNLKFKTPARVTVQPLPGVVKKARMTRAAVRTAPGLDGGVKTNRVLDF